MAAIEVMSLTKRYGRVCGVEDVTFSIERGEVFGYLGPNGSGKTTTLFYLVDGSRIWRGWPLGDMALLTAILLVAAIAGGIIWHRRDLPL